MGARAPWWHGPAYAIYALSAGSSSSLGFGFDTGGIVFAIGVYGAPYTILLRTSFKGGWKHADPLWILFDFSSRVAPFELKKGRNPQAADDRRPRPAGCDAVAMFASLFVLMASTTLDNVRATVGWSDLLEHRRSSLVQVGGFGRAGRVRRRVPGPVHADDAAGPGDGCQGATTLATARLFAWSLIPIGVAYVLAHNVSLLVIGFPTCSAT